MAGDVDVTAGDVGLDRTVVVGPEAAHAVCRDGGHGHGRRVSIGVACTDGGDRGRGTRPRQEVEVLVG